MLTRSTGNTGGLFEDVAAMQAAGSPNDRRLELWDGTRYQTAAAQGTDGLLLASGNYANPLEIGSKAMVTTFASGTMTIASGTTADEVIPAPPSGEIVVLTALFSTTTLQTNLTTIDVGGNTVVNAVQVHDVNQSPVIDNSFIIGGEQPNQVSIVGDVDEVITLKTNVARSSITAYAYQYRK